MKKHLLLQCLIYLGITTYGQNSIPNGNFESWKSVTYDNPQYYPYTSNSQNLFQYQLPINLIKTTDAYHGTYAVQLTTIANSKDTAFGYFLNSNPNSNKGPSTWTGGLAINKMPKGIRGFYKYNTANVDSGSLIIAFSQGGINIGSYIFQIGGIHNTYTMFNFNFIPVPKVTPDSVVFCAVSSKITDKQDKPNGVSGSILKIDSVSFTGLSSQPALMNGDFETWQSQTNNSPDNWIVQNSNGDGINLTTDAAEGSYAIELKTILGNSNNHPSAQPGRISTGYYPNNCDSNCYEKGGYPFTKLTDTLAFYYKFAPMHPKDSAIISLNFKKKSLQLEGRGIYLTASANYKYIEFPFSINQTPDSVIVDILSSNWNDTAQSFIGADLKIDEIHFKSQLLNTGILKFKNENTKSISVFPNPSNGRFQILSLNVSIQNVEIYDVLGKSIYSNSKFNLLHSNEIDLSSVQKGIYFVKVSDGIISYMNKIVIK